jgi:cyclase
VENVLMNGLIEMLTRIIGECQIVDLSCDVTQHTRGPFETHVEVLEAGPGAHFFVEQVLPRLLSREQAGRFLPEDFPGTAFLRHEQVKASVHAGSHIDAPGHYGPGVAADNFFINQAPLALFMGAAVLYDAAHLDGPEVTEEHFQLIGKAADISDVGDKIVLIRTGGNKAISPRVIEVLLDQGVQVIGTDNDSFDGPFQQMVERFLQTDDRSLLWPCHMLGRRRPYYQLERLGGLERLPPSGFFVLALPVLIAGTTAAWTRAIALIP